LIGDIVFGLGLVAIFEGLVLALRRRTSGRRWR
jgi:hypothetical protein